MNVHSGERWMAQPRLSVTISPDTEAALLEMRVDDGVSFTDVLRRLVGYGQAVYQASLSCRDIVLRGGGLPTARLRAPGTATEYGMTPSAGSGTGSWAQRRERSQHG